MRKGGPETRLRGDSARGLGRLLRTPGLGRGIWTLLGRRGGQWDCRGPALTSELFGKEKKGERVMVGGWIGSRETVTYFTTAVYFEGKHASCF